MNFKNFAELNIFGNNHETAETDETKEGTREVSSQAETPEIAPEESAPVEVSTPRVFKKVDRRPVVIKGGAYEQMKALEEMSQEDLVKLFQEMMQDPEIAAKVSDKVNIGFKTEGIINRMREESDRKAQYEEEQDRKWEEVERQRKIMSERTAAVLREAKEKADKIAAEKREMSVRTAAVIKADKERRMREEALRDLSPKDGGSLEELMKSEG